MRKACAQECWIYGYNDMVRKTQECRVFLKINITIFFFWGGGHSKFLQTAVSYPHVTFFNRICPSTSMRFRLKAQTFLPCCLSSIPF